MRIGYQLEADRKSLDTCRPKGSNLAFIVSDQHLASDCDSSRQPYFFPAAVTTSVTGTTRGELPASLAAIETLPL
jgi:hypothetical protein